MGQEHSLPVPRRTPNKLSKPRTTSTANLLSRSTILLNQKDVPLDIPGQVGRYSVVFADPDVRQVNVQEERQGRQKEEKRRSIFRSQSTPNRHSLPARPEENVLPYNYDVHSETRHNSMAEQALESVRPVNRSRMSLQHVPGLSYQQRLSLVQELPTPNPDTFKRLSTYAELRSPTIDSSSQAQTAADTNLYTPMRRSSFVQHGLATRPSLPQLVEPDSSDLNFSKPLPHAYLTSLKQQDMPRVETPDELGHTGAFMLGSLRITNGVASPTPSIERSATMSMSEDYISAGNVRKLLQHRREFSNRSNTMSIATDRVKTPWVVREESPLRKAELPPKIEMELENLADFDFSSEIEILSPSRSQVLADEYINEIILSPYSFVPSRSPSPRLEATSKHTAIEDQLFEDEPLTPALSCTPSIADSGYDGSRNGSNRKKQLAKADSGYSSNVSLRSFRAKNQRGPPVPPKDTSPRRENRMSSSRYSTSSELYKQTSYDEISQKQHLSSLPSQRGLTAATVSQEDLKGQKARQISIPDLRSGFGRSSRHIKTGSDSRVASTDSMKKDLQRPFSIQIPSQEAHDSIDPPPVPADISRQLGNRIDHSPFSALTNTFQRLQEPGNRDTLATIFSVGSGYTELPFSRSRRASQEVLASPTSLSTSNSYIPPKTPPRRLQKRSSIIHDMDAYETLQVTRRVSFDGNTYGQPTSQPRSPSVTAEINSILRDISGDSRSSSMTAAVGLTTKPSYESFSNQNDWSPHAQTGPVSAPLQNRFLGAEEPQRRLSWNRDKKQPPVSMQTQKRITPSPPTYNLFPTPSRRPLPVPLIPISKEPPPSFDLPPPPPIHKSLPPSPLPIQIHSPLPSPQTPRSFIQSPEYNQEPWEAQGAYWSDGRQDAGDDHQRPATRRKSSSEISQRPSMSTRNSSSTTQTRSSGRRPPSAHQNGNLRIQRNMEAVKARKMMEMDMLPEPQPQEQYQMPNATRQTRERDRAGEMLAGWRPNDDGSTPSEYHHAYGMHMPVSPNSSAYFSQPTVDDTTQAYDFHRRQNSTNDMLVLDRFSGGLDYAYQHGTGLSGSAGLSGGGPKKSVDVSRQFGLDFTDVPVFLQRVPGQGLRELHR